MSERPTLTRFLDPVTPAEFYASYHEQELLHVQREDRTYHDGLFSIRELEGYLASQRDSRDARLSIVPPPESDDEARRVSRFNTPLHELYEAFARGETLVMDNAEIGWPAFAKLAASLAHELSARVQINVYCTPPGPAQGFDVHMDQHDVFILQLEGTKEWEIHEPWYELPVHMNSLPSLYEHVDRHGKPEDPGPPARTLTLRPGDTLYLPRGLPHCAHTTESASLHATIGIHPLYYAHLLLYALGRHVLQNKAARRTLPPGFFGREAARAEMSAAFDELVQAFAQEPSFDAALEEAEAVVLGNQTLHPAGMFQQLIDASAISGETRLAVRPHLNCKTLVDEEHAYIYFADNHVRSPRWIEPALRHIEEAHGPFRVDDLPKPLSANSKLTLARKLIREGLLVIVP